MPLPTRDKVFISYSHRDDAWLDKVLIFLKPFLRAGTLSVWNDRYIEVGGIWRREIDDGLQRATVGLLLVSPHFLASDFIMDEELPALVEAAKQDLLTLVWVPISACHWKHSPLRDYQAAWDPGQPLDSLTEHPRNTALVQITEQVAEVATTHSAPVPTPLAAHWPEVGIDFGTSSIVVTAGPDVVSRYRRVPGDLHNVPDLPPHHIPRSDDLDRLRGVLLEHDSVAVGITGEQYRMGLHGQGGIGKSVLAAALARDEKVRLAFPDGVFWVSVGQTPDVLQLQAALLADAGVESAAVTDEQKGRRHLQERFADRAALLVLDDVWDHRHARAFDVLGAASRLLVTTRDGAVLTALGAHPETVQRLPEAAALALLSSWAGHVSEALPDAAREVARECGHLPLALALAGARVQDGTPWEILLKALKQGRLEFLDHPYGSVFGSMRLSVDALPTDDRERYLELAVFLEDERVPVPVVLTLWKETAGLDELTGEALLTRLRSKALLEMPDTGGRRAVALHDLQHDFLRLSVRDLPSLHEKLLWGLAAELPAVDEVTPWWLLPTDEAYAWSHLAGHLVAAGRGEELRSLLFDCRWLEAKLRMAGLPAVLADFAALPREEEMSLVAGAVRLSGHVIGSDPSQVRSQLTGRLLGVDRPRIAGLLRGAVTAQGGPWLRPASSSLTLPTGSLLRTLGGYNGNVWALAVTPDARRAVSGSSDRAVKVWDLDTGEEERTLAGHVGSIWAVVVTADGRCAVSGSADQTVKVWNLETGLAERTLAGHTAPVLAVAVTTDGRCAISGSADQTVKVWDLESGAEPRTLLGHADAVRAVAVTEDGRRAVSSSRNTLTVWDLETGKEERTLVGHTGPVSAVAVTADGRRAVSGSYDWTVRVWDLETGAEERALVGHWGPVTDVAVTADGRRAVSGSYDRSVKVWNLETGQEERTLEGHGGWVWAVAVTPDGQRAISGSGEGPVKVWDLETSAEERTLVGHKGWLTAVAVTADGRRAVSGSDDQMIKIWDLKAGVEECILAGYTGAVRAVAVTADGRRAVSVFFDDQTMKVWDLKAGTEERTLVGHVGAVRAVAVTADNQHAVSGSDDGTVKVWDLVTGMEERTLIGYSGPVTTVAVTADNQHAVSGSDDGTVKVWNLVTGTEERTLIGHSGPVTAVAVTADGRHALSGSDDWTVRVWDLATGEKERTLTGHASAVTAVAVTADGQRAVSGSGDRTVKVWDLESGHIVATFTADALVLCCAVATDGVRLVAGDGLGRLHLLSLEGLPPE